MTFAYSAAAAAAAAALAGRSLEAAADRLTALSSFELADPWFSGEVKTAPFSRTHGRSGE